MLYSVIKMNRQRIIFTGGGTGGHVYPNIAIFEALKDKYPETKFLYMGTKDGAEKKIIKKLNNNIDFITIPSKGLPLKIKSLGTIFSLFIIFIGFVKSFFILRRFKPNIIIGSGGYVAAPVLLAAALLKIKVFIHEQNAVPGRLNMLIAKFATKIGISFKSTGAFLPTHKIIYTGYPLRKSIRLSTENPEIIKKKYNIPIKNKVLFVFGGSGGARTINKAMVEIIPMLLSDSTLTIIFSTGRGYSKSYKAYDDTVELLSQVNIPPEIDSRLIIREYYENIDEIYAISDLIVCRAGAGTIKEITVIKKPSILIPKLNLPGDHQILNAKELKNIGAAEIIYEDLTMKDNSRDIYIADVPLYKKIKELISSKTNLKKIQSALSEIKQIDSPSLIVNEIEKIIAKKKIFANKKLKTYYIQSLFDEKTYEMVFNSTSFGNSFFSDYNLGHFLKNVYFEIKTDNSTGKMLIRRIRGKVFVNEKEVEKWCEIKEEDIISIPDDNNDTYKFSLKTYTEEIDIAIDNKSTALKIRGSSLGILVSRMGGFLREVVTAAVFGAGKIMDIFSVGLTLSNLIRRIVAENAMDNIFLPIFSRLLHRSTKKKVWTSSSSIINVTLLISLIFTILGIIFAPVLIRTLFPGLIAKGVLNETINMTRLMFPYLILVTISAIMSSYLKAFNRFGTAEASMIFYSVGIVSSILLLNSTIGIYSLAIGVLLGGILQILFLFPFTAGVLKQKSLEFSYKPVFNFSSSTNKRYYSQLWPISIDVLLSKLSEIIDQFIASGLSTGTLSYIYYSKTIFRLPFAIISQGINTVILKEFSEKIALFDKDKAKRLFVDGVKTNVFLLMPISIIMFLFSKEIVSILLERFSFNTSDVIFTSQALKAYSVGLVGWGVYSLTSRIFSARIDIKTSMILNAIMITTNISLCFYLVNTELGFIGLALASSISFILFSTIRVIVLKYKLKNEDILVHSNELTGPILKSVFSAFIMSVVLIETKIIFSNLHFSSKLASNLTLLISSVLIGFATYFLSSIILKNTEVLIFKKRKPVKSKKTPLNLLSPFGFLNSVQGKPEQYGDDYNYKINVYTSSSNWAVQNIGIKLIGLFKDLSKINILFDIIDSKKNNFIKRNAVNSLSQLNIWNPQIKDNIIRLLSNSYYEIRIAAIMLLIQNMPQEEYNVFEKIMIKKFHKVRIEEKLSYIKFISKFGNIENLNLLKQYFLHSNSLIREEILSLLLNFYKRKILNAAEIKKYIERILITSNNFRAEFKLKQLIRIIYREIE